jgi:hypothetical protein
MRNNNIYHYCRVCNQQKENGIMIYQAYICTDCEKEILSTDPADEKYQIFVEKLKISNPLTKIHSL